MNYLPLFFSATVMLIALLLIKHFKPKAYKITSIICSVLVGISLVVFYFSSTGSQFLNTQGLKYNMPFSSAFLTFLVVITIWLMFVLNVVVILKPYFTSTLISTIIRTFGSITIILMVSLLNFIAFSFTGSNAISFTSIMLAINFGFVLAEVIVTWVEDFRVKPTKKDIANMFIFLPIVMLFSIPPYLLQTIFGIFGAGMLTDLKILHRIYIYITFVFLIGMYFLLKKRDKEFSRMILLMLSLGALLSYCYDYDYTNFARPWSWPLHLCNTAMFIIPLCLAFRMNRLFYFTLFINVVGAFIAMLVPNYNEAYGIFSHVIVRFWLNHSLAFAMPVLIILLGIYKRPNLKSFGYSMLWFVLYFVLVLVFNAWFSNYGVNVDYFFLNSDFIANKLGQWAERIMDITLSFRISGLSFTFYPLYQVLFFIVYNLFGLGMWFVYVFIFSIQDFYAVLAEKNRAIRQDEILLQSRYENKPLEECMNKDSVNKLVVKNVSKRYGTNTNYSVRNASFEVEGGEILGFLGPNGAGKSTIIKCIVGIQPATSGSIEINGYDISTQAVLAKEQFGFVPDHYALYEKLTGREYINYMADLYGVSKQDREKRLQKLLKNLSMEASIDSPIRTYSHGMKQKITIMSALIHNPKLWILDEPLTGLDPNSIYEVKECMKQHAKAGNIVFFSSHIIDIVEKLCNRIIIIKKGNIVTSVTLEELKEKGISLEEFYLDIINNSTPTIDLGATEPVKEVTDQNPEKAEKQIEMVKKTRATKKRGKA